MVLFLQLCLFLIAIAIRGRYLFGWHLSPGWKPGELKYVSKNKGSVTARHVGITQIDGIPFIVKEERWYHRLLKGLGVASEVKIPNTQFDKHYFIATDHPTDLERAMSSGALVTQLAELFSGPVKSLHATPDKIWCIMGGTLHEEGTYYEKEFEMLKKVSESTKRSATKSYSSSRPVPLGAIALTFICVHAGLLTYAALGFAPTLIDNTDIVNNQAWYVKGITAGAVGAGIWLFLILNIFRKSSWVCWVLVDFVLCGIIGFVLSGVFLVREANIDLPQPIAHTYQQPVIKKFCELKCSKSCGRRCTRRSNYPIPSESGCAPTARSEFMQQMKRQDYICNSNARYVYTLEIQHWQRDSTNYSFSPSASVFDATHINAYMNVPVHKGALGLEWVDTDQIQAK